MEHVAGSVLGATDLGVRIIGIIPVLIGGLAALTFAVKSCHGGRILSVHSCLLGELFNVVPVTLFRVATGQAAEAGIGLHD